VRGYTASSHSERLQHRRHEYGPVFECVLLLLRDLLLLRVGLEEALGALAALVGLVTWSKREKLAQHVPRGWRHQTPLASRTLG